MNVLQVFLRLHEKDPPGRTMFVVFVMVFL